LHLRASALQIFLQRICVAEFSATQMQRQKFCNADAHNTKPSNSYVHPLQRRCNAEKSAMQMQVQKICNADAKPMHAHATKLAWKLQKLAWKFQKHAWKLQFKLHTCGSKGQEK